MYPENDGKINNQELNKMQTVVCDLYRLRTNTTQPLTKIISELYGQKILLVTRTKVCNSIQK